MSRDREPAIAVIGGGVIGLSSALAALQAGYKQVTIIADKWTPDTVSDGAGAFWERHYDGHAKWARETMMYYTALVRSGEAKEAGVGFIDGYQFHHDYQKEYPFSVDVPAFRRATHAEVAAASARMGEKYVDGCFWRSVIADSPTYMMWLMRKIREAGGKFVHKRVESVEELMPYFDVIMNCTGLGARELVSDAAVHVARGQLIRVYAPHIKNFYTTSAHSGSEWHGAYVLPRPTSGVVTLGGTFERGREYYGVDPANTDFIWNSCLKLCPELADPSVIRLDDWTGMRPARHGDVRLEAEERDFGAGRRGLVVHNYGHAGCGHSLHYGCARDALRLLQEGVRKLDAAMAAAPAASRRRACDVFVGPEPVLREGVHTVLPRLMRAAGGAVPSLQARL